MSMMPSTPRLSTPERCPNVSPSAAYRYGVASRMAEKAMPARTDHEMRLGMWALRANGGGDGGGGLGLSRGAAAGRLAPHQIIGADDHHDHHAQQRVHQRCWHLHRALHDVRPDQQ